MVCTAVMESADDFDHRRFEAMVLQLPDTHRRVLSAVMARVEHLEREGQPESAHRLLEQILSIVQTGESPS